MATHKTVRAFASSMCASCRQRLLPIGARRTFTTAQTSQSDVAMGGGLASLSNSMSRSRGRGGTASGENTISRILEDSGTSSLLSYDFANNLSSSVAESQPYRFHVFATKHNTHITFVQPPRLASQTASSTVSTTNSSATQQKKEIDVLLSVSAGNIGFKKAGRGSYDAAYQLAAFALTTMKEKGMLTGCRSIEVVLRGFGAGREAVTKVLLGTEGRLVRPLITSVKDATRLKQGGPRGKKPRRLG